MGKTGYTGIRRLVWAARFSLRGLAAAWRHESAFRQECAVALIALPLALWLGGTAVERALLAGSVGFVLIVELLNSGIEAVVDRIGADEHPLSGRAKDMGSAAVLLAIVVAVMIWLLVLLA